MPFFSFKSEADKPMNDRKLIIAFSSYCIKNGCWFHPFHTMFLNGSHTRADIEATLKVTANAFVHIAALRDGGISQSNGSRSSKL